MFDFRRFYETVSTVLVAFVLSFAFLVPAYAVKMARFGKGPIVVRLCPAKCVEVSGHGFRSGRETAVFESRGGWSRVSAYIDPEKLRPNFGARVPAKPAFWIRSSQLLSSEATVTDPIAAEIQDKPKVDPKPADKQKKEKKPAPAKKVAKVKRQRRRVTIPTARPGKTEEAVNAPIAGETQEIVAETAKNEAAELSTETDKVKQQGAVAVDQEKTEEPAKPMKAPQPVAEPAGNEVVQPAEEVVVAETVEQPAAAKQMPKANEAPVVEVQEPAPKQVTVAADDSTIEPQPTQSQTEETKPAEPKPAELKSEEPKHNEPANEVAKTVEVPAEPSKPDVKTSPTFAAENEEPLIIDERPKTYTKELRDKRLAKLPNSKTRGYKIEEVIALRHYALTLLKNKQCNRIVRGGRSIGQQGILFVVCKNDPTYLHQFPLEEQTW